jgi:RIO-like serine/threonine protein kinase
MANQTMKLAVGGPVQAKYGTYLPRPADEELLHACQAGKFAYVLACRQIGKSSLMFATSEKLCQAGVRTALVDLNSIGQNVEADSWYFSLIDTIARKLDLKVDVQAWWEERPHLSTLNQRFLQFLREVVLQEISGSVVIFVDEIDMTLGLGFTDDFFAAIRSVHNDRAQDQAYHRLTFVLLGVATPDELIKDHTRTPFNIGQAITLNDFTKKECELIRQAITAKYPTQGRHYFDQIYAWTGGHPYLTQKLCDALLKADALELEMAHATSIDPLVIKHFLAPEARGEDNIQFVQTRVTSDPYAQDMLKIYKRILENETPVADDEQSTPINRLKLYGLVVAQSDRLEVRNKLYKHAFDLAWANEMRASVRLGLPNRYKILQEIGQGGFSTVYLAQLQVSGQTQSVALKVLKSTGAADTTQVKRFKQEARAVARLQHPNIIRIFETSGDEEPSFIAMEYVPGGTLRDRLKSAPLARREAVDIVRQIGAALSYAHAQGIIHRDVNPNNILLDMRQEPVRPVLTDFGLVKLLLRDEHTQVTSTSIIGTLDYMAPEQWRQETPTPATDLYALALTFFEMLSGRRPFDSELGYYDLMKKHLDEGLPLLSNVAPEIGPFFNDILGKAAAKEPADRFVSIADFMEALAEADQQAEEVERVAQQNQAAKMVEAAQGYVQKGRYNPDHALAMIEAALEVYPGFLEALRLRGKFRLQQGQLEKALADYRQAYGQVADPASEIGREYLDLLSNAAETAWQRQQFLDAAKYYQTIRQLLPDTNNQVLSGQEIGQKAQARLVEYYHHEANLAFAGGHPEHADTAIEILGQKIQELKALAAGSEIEDLQGKLKQLQITKYEHLAQAAQAAIGEINTKDTHSRFLHDDIFQHYATLDEAYQALSELEPENESWPDTRRKKLREVVESRCVFAARALAKLEPDYEAALRHYKAALELDRTKYPGVIQNLHFNLEERIAELQLKVDYDGKYNDIRKLIEGKEYLKALERLDQEFIRAGNYEHREAAKWLWGLVYAKQHEWMFPPEWESLSGFELLSKRLTGIEKGQMQLLRNKLEPWSQTRILETIDRENKRLREYEEQVKRIETSVNEAIAHGVAETRDVEICRNELAGVRTQIQRQHEAFYQIEVNDTVQKIEALLQRIEDIEALLQTGNPLKDIPEFITRIDEVQQAIEAEEILKQLQALISSNAEIERTLNQLKLNIRGRLIGILIGDVGHRDEELIAVRQEAGKVKEELVQVQTQATKTQEKLAGLPQQVEILKQQLKSVDRQHEINRYLIPISLVLALIAGGIIASHTKILSGLPALSWVALGLLIVYFAYYAWVYYFTKR